MRALGPGSVSSLLKTALDVAFVILWIAALGVLVGLLATLVAAPFIPANLRIEDFNVEIDGRTYDDIQSLIPAVATGLGSLLLYLAGLVAIVGRMRRIFATLIAGDPFHPDNVRRLRFIGAVLAGLLLLGSIVPGVLGIVFPELGDGTKFSFNPTSWFAVLVVFVLAEVFREGARLRHDAELTI
jgi:hypothetical protein